ncbi:MAG: hypothetical protein OHK0029_34350 [Armatimonadaceae bacterium]
MQTKTLPRLTARGLELDTASEAFGFLRDSSALVEDAAALRDRFAEDGYLYLPDCLNREEVIAARQVITQRLFDEGLLEGDPMEGRLRPDSSAGYFRPNLTRDNPELMRVLYDGAMMAIFERLFGEPVRHFDYTWFRSVGKGHGTAPHCDIVYMGRGTHDLCTAWTPIGDISLELGGLIILEGSHQKTEILAEYLAQDVDSYCENGPNAEAVRTGKLYWEDYRRWQEPGAGWDGSITHNPVLLRQELGGRWLTSPEYRMGDVLIFSIQTVHASIDNQTEYIRLSSDSRYQPASHPADERWILGRNGEAPYNHQLAAKKGRIC